MLFALREANVQGCKSLEDMLDKNVLKGSSSIIALGDNL